MGKIECINGQYIMTGEMVVVESGSSHSYRTQGRPRFLCRCRDCKTDFFDLDRGQKYCPKCKKNAALSKLACVNSDFDYSPKLFPKSKCKICRGTGYSIKNQKPCWECCK